MSRRPLIVAGIAVAAVATALPAAASSSAQKLPVGVVYTTDHGVGAGVTINDQPGAGAWVRYGRACAGISYEIPFCVDLPPTT